MLNPIVIFDNLQTGVTQNQVQEFLNSVGEGYYHFANERYPNLRGTGMLEQVILKHIDAQVYISENPELCRVFAFSKEEAHKEFLLREEILND